MKIQVVVEGGREGLSRRVASTGDDNVDIYDGPSRNTSSLANAVDFLHRQPAGCSLGNTYCGRVVIFTVQHSRCSPGQSRLARDSICRQRPQPPLCARAIVQPPTPRHTHTHLSLSFFCPFIVPFFFFFFFSFILN